MDADTMAFIVFNWTFTLDKIETRLNRILKGTCPTKLEMDALGRDFFSVLVDPEEFVYLHSLPYPLGRLLLHQDSSKTRGFLVFHYIPSKPALSQF